MRLIIFLSILLTLTIGGCASYNQALMEIPEAGFTKFSYDRSGNVTSAHLEANDAKIINGELHIGSITATGDYGPAFNYKIYLEGYVRKIKNIEEVSDGK